MNKQKSRTSGLKSTISILLFSGGFFLCACLTSCYEKVEGCLDVAATNFDLDADIACEDCCVYPKLKVSFLHQVKDNSSDIFYNFSLNTPYTFERGDTFRMSSIRYYLSDFKLIVGTDSIGVEDKVEIAVPSISDTLEVEDNFVLVDRSNPTSSDVGTIRGEFACTGLTFKLGIKDAVNLADPTFFETTHPLYSELDGELYFSQDSGYVFNRLEFFRTPTDTLSSTILMGTSDFLQTIVVDFTFNTKIGFNTTVVLRVDYREWLKTIDFKNDSEAVMAEKIRQGIATSFSISEVQN